MIFAAQSPGLAIAVDLNGGNGKATQGIAIAACGVGRELELFAASIVDRHLRDPLSAPPKADEYVAVATECERRECAEVLRELGVASGVSSRQCPRSWGGCPWPEFGHPAPAGQESRRPARSLPVLACPR